jgi:hypothetical protein
MKETFLCFLIFSATILSLGSNRALAQSDTPKVEVGAQFSLLNIDRVRVRGNEINLFAPVTEPGFGGRFTFNLTKNLGLDSEVNFFPRQDNGSTNLVGRRITQGLFGAKVGKRFEKAGVFGKARPGFVSYSNAILSHDARITTFQFGRLTHFAFDVGGVVELYPSRRTVVRLDVGDTIVRYGSQTFIDIFGQPNLLAPFTRHNLQFGAGVGFRF